MSNATSSSLYRDAIPPFQYLGTFKIRAIYLPGSNGEIADKISMEKIDFIFRFACDAINTHFAKFPTDNGQSKLIYESYQTKTEPTIEVNEALFAIYIEGIKQKSAYVKDSRGQFNIPKHVVEALSTGQDVSQYSKNEKMHFEELLCYVLHEILHSCGAFHCDRGIMSGKMSILDNNEVNLEHVLDEVSMNLVRLWLDVVVVRDPPSVRCLYFMHQKGAKFFNTDGIDALVFLNQTKYTNTFSFNINRNNAYSNFPKNFDEVVVVYKGGYIIIPRATLEDEEGPCRIRCRNVVKNDNSDQN